METYKHSDLTHKIIGCAMQVHSFLGNGFQEVIYQRALTIEFAQAGLEYQRNWRCQFIIRNMANLLAPVVLIFLVDTKVLVEIKAITKVEDVHLAQILNYLRAYKIETDLLINFGERTLNFKRVVL